MVIKLYGDIVNRGCRVGIDVLEIAGRRIIYFPAEYYYYVYFIAEF